MSKFKKYLISEEHDFAERRVWCSKKLTTLLCLL